MSLLPLFLRHLAMDSPAFVLFRRHEVGAVHKPVPPIDHIGRLTLLDTAMIILPLPIIAVVLHIRFPSSSNVIRKQVEKGGGGTNCFFLYLMRNVEASRTTPPPLGVCLLLQLCVGNRLGIGCTTTCHIGKYYMSFSADIWS